jgi:hypothetical protein
MKHPKVTIIFPNLNGGENPLKCLRSIEKLNFPKKCLKTIVVDNSSTDGSPLEIQKKFPWAKVIIQKKNLGFAGAINVGIKNGKSDYFFITNDDIGFARDSLKILINYVQKQPKVGIVGGKQLYPQTKKFLAGGRNFNFLTGQQINLKKVNSPRTCDQIDGCTMLIRRKVIDKIGLFDEDFYPAYWEDLDFCIRAKRAGFKIVYHPKAIFYHNHAATTSKWSLNKMYFLGAKYRLRIYLKHANLFEFSSFIIFHFFLVIPFRIVIHREPILVPEVRALFWNLKNFRKTLSARKLYSDII